jgi:putative SOS response-associated peptidase YedK
MANGYAPVMVMENGRRVIKPMRYQCRPAGKPAFYDTQFPGTYNARRDNLRGFWKGQYGHTHGLILVDAFYENVAGPPDQNRYIRLRATRGLPNRYDPFHLRAVGGSGPASCHAVIEVTSVT